MNQIFTAFLTLVVMAGAYSNTVKAAGLSIEELKSQADAEYAQRDYTPGGVAHAQSAMDKFSQLSKMTSDQDLVSQFNLGIIKSNYFIGDNNTDKATQKQIFLSGMDMSDSVLKNFGIGDTKASTLTDALAQSLNSQLSSNKDKMDILIEALYQKAANMGQWGQTDVVGALVRWPELRNITDFISKLSYISKDSATPISYKSVHSFAGYRIVGRGFYVIPGLLGGDKVKAEKFLDMAVKSTMAVDSSGKALGFSTNGYNNLYLSDVLRANNKSPLAKTLLSAFVAADPKDSKIFPQQEELVDILKTQKEARDVLGKL